MRTRALSFLVCAGLALGAGAGTTARAATSPVLVSRPAPDQGLAQFHLQQAVGLRARGDFYQVIAELELVDTSVSSNFAEADRAAFLLGEALLQVQDRDGFLQLAATAGASGGSPYREWIAWRALSLGAPGAVPEGLDDAGLLAASLLLEQSRSAEAESLLNSLDVEPARRALRLYLLADARTDQGKDAHGAREDLAAIKPANAIESTLVGSALIALAVEDLNAGKDATAHLERVPSTSQDFLRARHMLALIAIQDGRPQDARALLEPVSGSGAGGALFRESLLLDGSLALDSAEFDAASRQFEVAESDFLFEHALLDSLQSGAAVQEAWAAWDAPGRNELRPADPAALTAQLVTGAVDLRKHKPGSMPGAGLVASTTPGSVFDTWRPSMEQRNAAADMATRVQANRTELASVEHELQLDTTGLGRRLRYLQTGQAETRASLSVMDDALRALEARLAELDRTLAAMDSVQAAATRAIVDRTRRILTELDRDRLFLAALQHFHVDGPDYGDRAEATSLLQAETSLATELAELARLFGETMPMLVDRSFDEHLEPRLAGGSRSLYAQLSLERDRAAVLATDLDSLAGIATVDPALIARRDALAAEGIELAAQEQALRLDIAQQVATRGQATLALERESLDYHLADAAFESAIALTLDPATSEDPALLRPARERASRRLEDFLLRHPDSFARAESRFRLADLRVLQARDDFQVRMAEFLGEKPDDRALNDRALAPYIDTAPAVALYRDILAEDPDFAHLDAVLFSLGMILSDDGQAEGVTRLTELVKRYPDSAHAQEAWLRLGDDRFDAKDFAAAIPCLEHAANGPEASFSAIALYKLGWSHFEEDRFTEAADGFRRLLDLYAAHDGLAQSTDLRDEAEEYLVHSLARGGGADEFARYFDRLGGRDYESRILSSMGALLKSYSLYTESIACDRMWLARYPNDPAALNLAERLVDSYGRDNRAEESRAVRLELAAQFMEDSAWYSANPDPELQARGVTFAQTSYRESALFWHHVARESKKSADWEQALALYETYLAHWANDPESARLHYQAGEAARELAHYDRALDHFAVAAADTADFAADAAWQRVATADLWYSSTNEPDSLAARVLTSGDAYLQAWPADERAADLRWRQAQIAYRHNHDLDAAERFGAMATFHPDDPRVPAGLRLRGDAFHRSAQYRDAALAYEQAQGAAIAAGQDSLATALAPVIPLSWYEFAEFVADQDSLVGEQEAAPHFIELARRFPDFEHADQALYRGGLGYLAADAVDPAVDAFSEILRTHPDSEHARDASVQIAQAYEKHDRPDAAATAWATFSRDFSSDPDAPAALLRSADLTDDHGRSEELRTEFLQRYPGETDAVLEIRETRARESLERVGGGVSLTALLRGSAEKPSDLQAYLDLAQEHPELASAPILAQVSYLEAEDIRTRYEGIALTQPLDASIKAKQASLEQLLAAYGQCVQQGVRVWTRASAHRIGEALIGFGDALMASERPGGLNEDELYAYNEVLEEQSWAFFDRGEQAWNELLQQNPMGSEDPDGWLARTREALWPRVARRFVHQPTAEYPSLRAEPPVVAVQAR